MDKPKLLDLFCKAGGCTKGYQRGGFFVVGVDTEPQPRYCGDAFVQMDALEALRILIDGGYIESTDGQRWHLSDFHAIHASPPCQGYSSMRYVTGKEYPLLIDDVRDALRATGKHYIIENVEGAPLNGVILCGTMFDLKVFRHRIFESNILILQPPHIKHSLFGKAAKQGRPTSVSQPYMTVTGNYSGQDYARRAMGIDWMTRDEMGEAIPPAYTEYIGRQLMEYIKDKMEK